METFFLCDLTHRSVGVCSEMVPYPIGCIKSYFHEFSPTPADVLLFKYPERFIESFLQRRPSIVAFSNYMWNLDLDCVMAHAVKSIAPDTLVVSGGPNYPLEAGRQERWLRERPMIDVYLVGEGERPFAELAELWLQTHSIEAVKRGDVCGLHALVDGRLRKTTRTRSDGYDDAPRISDLNQTPSPYLKGYLDEFLTDPALVPLMECNRGCPFGCTFCVDGIGSRSKVNKVSVARLEAELTYIAQRHGGKYLFIADTNFGMYKEDVEFCRIMADVKERYHYPLYLQVSTGKNQKARAIECAELLKGSLRFSAAVQSLDEQVLLNIKRSNISYPQLIDAAAQVAQIDGNTYSDVILALPGDSRARHMHTVCTLIDGGLQQIRNHTLVILDGSELGTDQQRETFRIATRYRVIPRGFGVYRFGEHELRSAEIEEVCVENETLSFDDYIECRRFALTTILFHNDSIFSELSPLLRLSGCQVSDWLRHLHAGADAFPSRLKAIYDRFTAETITELAATREELECSIRTPGVIEEYVAGERGNNVLYGNQTRAYLTCMSDVTAVAYAAASELLQREGALELLPGYLAELERYAHARRRELLEFDSSFEETFDFDIVALEERHFDHFPEHRQPTVVRFYYDDWQKEFFDDQLRRYGRDAQAWTKMFSRAPIKKMFRRAQYAQVASTAPV
jgi:radical SAM superfamily enzyme YgiQ (UPF0313 family)